jgi:hypothetical protein
LDSGGPFSSPNQGVLDHWSIGGALAKGEERQLKVRLLERMIKESSPKERLKVKLKVKLKGKQNECSKSSVMGKFHTGFILKAHAIPNRPTKV